MTERQPPRPKAAGTDIPLPPPRPRQKTIPESPAPPPLPPDVAPQSSTLESVDAQAVPRERLPQGRPTRSVSPAPWDPRASSPELRREVERHGDRLAPPPSSTATPSPASADVDLRVGDVRVRVGSSVARRVLPWLAPVLLSVAGTAIGYLKGYLEGLAAAGRRVAAVEEGLRLNGEGDARLETRTRKELDRAFVILDDHDARLPKLEGRIGKVEQAVPKIEGIAPK